MTKLVFLASLLFLTTAPAQDKPADGAKTSAETSKVIQTTATSPVIQTTREQSLIFSNLLLQAQKLRADEKAAAAQAALLEGRSESLLKEIAEQLKVDLAIYEARLDNNGALIFVKKQPPATVAAPPDKKASDK